MPRLSPAPPSRVSRTTATALSSSSRSRRCGSPMRTALRPRPKRRSLVSRKLGSTPHLLRILKKRWQSSWLRSGAPSNEVRQMSNPAGRDAEAIAEIGPEGDGVLLAGLLQRQEGIAASSAVLAAGAAADLAHGHRVADILLRAVGVERHLGALQGDQQFGLAQLQAGERSIEFGDAG